MIDIHCHILPNVDDGSESLEESIKMAKLAESEGITKIVNTSHYHIDFKYTMGKQLKEEVNKFNEILKNNDIKIEIILGNEIYYTNDFIEKFNELDFFSINKSKYILIEFSPINFPKDIKDVIYEIKIRGFVPILAHVERYTHIQEDINIIFDCIKEGALIQMNASSIIGKNGKIVESTSKKLLDCNMVHFIATDAHSSTRRRPLMKDTYKYILKNYGNETANRLFEKNAMLAINNEVIKILEPSKYEEKRSFLKKIFRK
ncbi:MAG: tyrosine-protein phosphatase [Paraclostridium sp.]